MSFKNKEVQSLKQLVTENLNPNPTESKRTMNQRKNYKYITNGNTLHVIIKK